MGEILFLAHRFPFPPDRGDKIRTWHVLKALTALAPVHVGALVDDPRDFDHVPEVERICASVNAFPRRRSLVAAMASGLITGSAASVAAFASRALKERIAWLFATRPISTIFTFSGQMGQFVPVTRDGRRFIMDFGDVDSAKFEAYGQQGSGLAAFANRMEGQRLAKFEKKIAAHADVSLFVSAAEAQLFRERSGMSADRVRALENGIDLERYDPDLSYELPDHGYGPLVVFTGQMDYRPNIEAVCAFVKDTLPIIHSHVPNAKFAIVGRNPTAEVRALAANQGVIVTGEVPDTRVWLAAANLVVAPLKIARGVQNKVLEAMAMAKPVVVSPAGGEGIDAGPAHGLFSTLNPRLEAEQILSLIDAPDRAASFGAAARARMIARYSWDAQMAGLAGIVRGDC
jgi:polysaccharide biosynthesis protein PslH